MDIKTNHFLIQTVKESGYIAKGLLYDLKLKGSDGFKIGDVIYVDEFSEKGLFMGYDKHSREKVYIDLKKGVLLTGAYGEFVERFKKIYLNEDKITYALFNEIDPKKYYHYIIWVGPNIRNQFLFTPVYKEELQNKEIYLHQRDNKDEVIIHVGG